MYLGYWADLVSIIIILMYLVQAYAFYKLAEKAGVENPWLSFIPILQLILFLHIIDRSAWYVLVCFIPLVNIIAGIIFYIEFYKAFDIDTVLIVFAILFPVVGGILLLYMGFSDSIQYIGTNRY